LKRFLCGLVVLGLFLGEVGQARSDFIYWSDDSQSSFPGDIRRANLDGSGQQTVLGNLREPHYIALDISGGSIYWTDAGNAHIGRANLDGSGGQILVRASQTSSLQGIALDVGGGKMYWTDVGPGGGTSSHGNILRANFDGSGEQTLLGPTQVGHPRGIALDLTAGKMYWTEDGGGIHQANLDGSGQKVLLTRGIGQAGSIALDLPDGKMYWTSMDGGSIGRANLDGSGEETLVKNLHSPIGIALDVADGLMYWADNGSGDIMQANLDGSGQRTLLTGLPAPSGISLDLATPVSEPSTLLLLGISTLGLTGWAWRRYVRTA
jgi:low density lipoprotein receptor-related protein 5/6